MIKLGIVMDPIATINIKKDTSFAMLLEAQRRGYELHYMEMNDLYLINGEARARTRTLSVEQNYDKWYDFTGEQDLPLADLDVILMRKDPPFDTEFIYATYILERAEEKGTLIVNKPQSLRDCNEKLFTAWFSELTPETLVTRNKAQLKAFWEKHGDIIMKPLDGMGGASIFRVKAGDPNLGVIAETLTELGSRYCMAQNYLPAIKDGDKRVLVVDGEPVPYCLARIPQRIEHRRFWLLSGIRLTIIVLDADDNRKRYTGGNAHLSQGAGPRTHLVPERHLPPLMRCGLRFRNKRSRLTNGLIFNGGHHPGGDIKLQHLSGIATQRIADKVITLPGFLHLRRTTQLVEQFVIQRFTIH